MPERLYLDHNATSPLRPDIRAAMAEVWDLGPLNPSSTHAEGRAAKRLIEDARKGLAEVLSCPGEGVVFTSGGTEAIALALNSFVAEAEGPSRFFVGATEHDAVHRTADGLSGNAGVTVETVPVGACGRLDRDWLADRLRHYDAKAEGRPLLCAMLANNETGVLNDPARLAPLLWPHRGQVFVDAVQAVGKIGIDFANLGADMMSICAHKAGGPAGVGALIVKPGLGITPLLRGGGQESFRRAGTENVAGLVGLARTLAAADPSAYAELAALRDGIETALAPLVRVWGHRAERLPNTTCFSAIGFPSETQVMTMDLAGIAVSAGSACSSGKVRRSGVLAAMGASPDEAGSAVRISLGWNTPADAADRFVRAWKPEYERVAASAAA